MQPNVLRKAGDTVGKNFQGSCGSGDLLAPWDGGVRNREVTELLLLLKWGGADTGCTRQRCLSSGGSVARRAGGNSFRGCLCYFKQAGRPQTCVIYGVGD